MAAKAGMAKADSEKPGTGTAGKGPVCWDHVVSVVSAAILVGTQAIATAVAAGWAVAGLFNLGDIGEYGLMALFGALGVYGTIAYVRKASVAEPFYRS